MIKMRNKKAMHLVTEVLVVLIVLGVLLVIILVVTNKFHITSLKPLLEKGKEAASNLGQMMFPGSGTTTGGTEGSTTGGTSGGTPTGQKYDIPLKTEAKWDECNVAEVKSRINTDARVKTCWDGAIIGSFSGEAIDEKKFCACVNRVHVETGLTSGTYFVEAVPVEGFSTSRVRFYVYKEVTSARSGVSGEVWDTTIGKGNQQCKSSSTMTLCINLNQISSGQAEIYVSSLYTPPGTTLTIGNTYHLKKGADYKFNSQLGTHTIRYKDDTARGVFIYVSQANNPAQGFNCIGLGGWDVYIGSALCCSEKDKICGKVLERNTDYGYITYKVCETARC